MRMWILKITASPCEKQKMGNSGLLPCQILCRKSFNNMSSTETRCHSQKRVPLKDIFLSLPMDPFAAPKVSIVGSERYWQSVESHISEIITVHVYTICVILLLFTH